MESTLPLNVPFRQSILSAILTMTALLFKSLPNIGNGSDLKSIAFSSKTATTCVPAFFLAKVKTKRQFFDVPLNVFLFSLKMTTHVIGHIYISGEVLQDPLALKSGIYPVKCANRMSRTG